MSGARPRLAMLVASRGDVDGIRDYAAGLAGALRDDADVRLDVHWGELARGARVRSWARAGRDDVVLVHYNPFSWGRRGFAPGLVLGLAWLRLRRRRPLIVLLVHETWVGPLDLKRRIMGAWQQAQLRVLLAMSDVVLVSMERWLEQLGGRVARRARRIAIASNLPDRRGERDAARRRLGADDDAVVLVSFGTDHPSRQPARIAALANAASAAGLDVLVVNLGAGAPALPGLGDDVPIVTPGPLARDELAAHMAAGDLYLAPFVDGVSSRRTTMAAALQHALPVLGTRGVSTDAFLAGREPALTLVEVDDADGFVAAGLRLLGNRELRERGRTAARELYERELDWAAARERWRDVVAALGR